MEHFITQIRIGKVRHLENLVIPLSNTERKHLILTGKNGSGKTSILEALSRQLQNSFFPELTPELRYPPDSAPFSEFTKLAEAKTPNLTFQYRKSTGVSLVYSGYSELIPLPHDGSFVFFYAPAVRSTQMLEPKGAERVELEQFYPIYSTPSEQFLKYMVHLKTQQAFARANEDKSIVQQIDQWFDRLSNALKLLLDNDSIELRYDYRRYQFQFLQDGREPFGFDQLSDGYSSVIRILADLILRMDRNWLLKDKLSTYDMEGIVLIDELETHLHIDLQRKILPFLTTFFPRVQFIVSTHSPYVLGSISNAVIYDLERQLRIENLSGFAAEDIAEGYFEAPAYSEELNRKLNEYKNLCTLSHPTDEERARRGQLRSQLKQISGTLAPDIRMEFERFEGKRRSNGQI